MAMAGLLKLFFLLVSLTAGVVSLDSREILEIIDERFDHLLGRIKVLEDKDVASRTKIATMEAEFGQRENALMSKIAELERRHDQDIARIVGLTTADDASDAQKGMGTDLIETNEKKQNDKTVNGDRTDDFASLWKQDRARPTRRAAAQARVAFFAVGPDFDFSRMAPNQSITYAPPTTNIGNAFNHGSGKFVAPLTGTYAFFVTICGKLYKTNNFNIDHNGAIKAKLFIGPTLSQTSQTVIINMRAGDSLSVKSGRPDNGVFGSFYTSISGYLLFERASPFTAVGK